MPLIIREPLPPTDTYHFGQAYGRQAMSRPETAIRPPGPTAKTSASVRRSASTRPEPGATATTRSGLRLVITAAAVVRAAVPPSPTARDQVVRPRLKP